MAASPRTRRLILTVSIAVIGILAMLAIVAILGPARLVAGDGHYVFAAGRSLAYDGDLDLTNQYWVMGDRWGLGRDPTSDRWRLPAREIGPSLVMIPGLWLHRWVGASASWEPAFACLGAAASLGPCWLGCVRTIDAAGLGISPGRVELLAGAAVFGFVAPFYAVGSSGYPHAIDAAVGAWLAWALVGRRYATVIGALLACAVLTRMQNALWLLWPIAELAIRRDRNELRRLAVIAAVGALGLLPQLWLGLAHPGSERGAIGWTLAFFNLDDYPRDLIRVLFGVHGLARWTPIAALALIGLALERRRRVLAFAVLIGLWLLLASVRDVDGGDAFGARRLAGVVGLLALGLGRLEAEIGARLGPRVRRAWMVALALLVAANLVVTGLAIAGRISLASPDQVRGLR